MRDTEMFKNTVKALSNAIIKHQVRAMSGPSFKTLAVTQPIPFVHHVEFNRPEQFNAFDHIQWLEVKQCFDGLNENPECRAIVLSGAGKYFTAGLNFKDAMSFAQQMADMEDPVHKGHFLEKKIKAYQDAISSLEVCLKPVIASIHSGCIGAGVSLITAADIRYCTEDAWFTVKEIDLGLAADVGALQRLPKVIGNQSLARELCFTGRKFDSKEAFSCGLVSKVFPNRDELIRESLKLAEVIASKNPPAVQATKKNLVYSLEHTNQEGLDQIKEINRLNLQGEGFAAACIAQATKGDPPVFAKL